MRYNPNHSMACSNRDYDFFYEGLEQERLLVQCCDPCGRLRNPPSPMCPACHQLAWSARQLAGTGSIYTYSVHHHPPLPDFALPHPVGVVEMDEGIRLLGGLDGLAITEIAIGLRVRAEFLRRGRVASFRFRRA